MKYLAKALILLIPHICTAQGENPFQLWYDLGVQNGPWSAICLDGGDFNNDGFPDFAALYSDNPGEDYYLHTFLGNGDCTFTPFTMTFTHPLGSITVNDFNNDGYDDLLIGEGCCVSVGGYPPFESDIIHLFEGNGDGTFTELGTLIINNVWVTSGDLNEDGNVDIVVSNAYEFGEDSVSIALGYGDFTFQGTASYEIPYGILHTVQILGDMDLDGNADIGVLTPVAEICFLYGNGDGSFQPATNVAMFSCGPSYCFIEPGDFNEDGRPDFVASCGEIVADYDIVFVWNGSQYSSADSLTSRGTWLAVRDFDLDTHLDIALVCSFAPAYVFPGIGDGTFSTPYQITSVDTWSVISEDFDLDGDYDLVFCEGSYFQQYHVRCYRNTTISQGCEEGVSSNASLSVSPNPFSTSLSITYSLPGPGLADLSVYDLSGRVVEDLVSETMTGGVHTETWNPALSIPDGCYLIVLDACGERAVRRCVKLD